VQVFMLASFFEVDVCSLARKGEQTQLGRKKEDGAEAGVRAGGPKSTGSPVTAVLARPVRDRRPTHAPLATRANTCARRQLRGREARTTIAMKREVQRLQTGVRFGVRRAQQAPASASMAAATSDGKSSARRNAWPIRETSSCRAAI
jgi:hypothetical protein